MDLSSLLSISRIANIFGKPGLNGPTGVNNPMVMNMGGQDNSTQIPNTDPTQVNQASPNLQDAISAMRSYNPSTVISKQYADALSNMPQRTDPSLGRRILGSIAGLSTAGPATYEHGAALGLSTNPQAQSGIQDEIANKPYYQKLNDWTNRVNTLGKGAAEEDRQNANQRIVFNQGENADIKRAALDEKVRADKEKETIQNRRADAYVFDKEHPDWKPFPVKGGNLIYVNPKDPSQVHDTGINTGTLTDEERVKLGVSGRLTEIAAQGSQQRQTESVKEQNRQSDISSRGEQTRTTNVAKTTTAKTGGAAKDLPPSQIKIQQYNKAKEALLRHPEWAPYIHVDTSGANTFTVDPPSTGSWFSKGPDADMHKNIVDYITTTPIKTATAPAPNGSNVAAPDNVQAIRKEIPGHPGKYAVSKDGGKTWKAE